MKPTVIYHRADYDGIFSREIARKFLPDAELIGWDFGDPVLPVPEQGAVYVLDLPVDRVFGWAYHDGRVSQGLVPPDFYDRLIWIDHHKSSIDTHPPGITGYRIDGVAACRLAWQWFKYYATDPASVQFAQLPTKEQFVERRVSEPLAVRLAGEYDVWDHRDNDADVAFQFGLDSEASLNWDSLLSLASDIGGEYAATLVQSGRKAMQCYKTRDAEVMRSRSFPADFEGLKFLCLNTARCNSNTFAERDKPETGHDALMAFFWTGKEWSVSMYHAAHRKDLDLSLIAQRRGGGGHRGACGFRTSKFTNDTLLPFA